MSVADPRSSSSASVATTPAAQPVVVVASPSGAGLASVGSAPNEQVAFLSSLEPRTVLLVAVGGGDDDHRLLSRLVRAGIAPGVRVHAVSAPPTLLALAGWVLGQGFHPGDALEVVKAVQALTTTVAITGSVGRLETPTPSVRQHLRGLLPGGRFVVDVPGNRVYSGLGGLKRLQRMHRAVIAVGSAEDAVSTAWRQSLTALAPGAQTVTLPAVGLSASPWRSRRWAEASTLAAPVHAVADNLRRYLPRQACSSCREPISGPLCPLCGSMGDLASPATAPGLVGEDAHTDAPVSHRLGPEAVDEAPVTVRQRVAGWM